ncbi:MAG TPA: hypothetical protein VD866_33350 [Urbifossiella sp.]|nr:hypothetical protein [Urbifossiella sp.]
MFTREDLVTGLDRLAVAPAPPLEMVEFGHQDFTSPCSEQLIEVCSGLKADFDSPLLFWVKALQAQDWAGREARFTAYTLLGLYKPMAATEFAAFVADYSGSLVRPLPPVLLALNGFQTGLRMSADWNDVAAVAELDETYVAYFWSTTA